MPVPGPRRTLKGNTELLALLAVGKISTGLAGDDHAAEGHNLFAIPSIAGLPDSHDLRYGMDGK